MKPMHFYSTQAQCQAIFVTQESTVETMGHLLYFIGHAKHPATASSLSMLPKLACTTFTTTSHVVYVAQLLIYYNFPSTTAPHVVPLSS